MSFESNSDNEEKQLDLLGGKLKKVHGGELARKTKKVKKVSSASRAKALHGGLVVGGELARKTARTKKAKKVSSASRAKALHGGLVIGGELARKTARMKKASSASRAKALHGGLVIGGELARKTARMKKTKKVKNLKHKNGTSKGVLRFLKSVKNDMLKNKIESAETKIDHLIGYIERMILDKQESGRKKSGNNDWILYIRKHKNEYRPSSETWTEFVKDLSRNYKNGIA